MKKEADESARENEGIQALCSGSGENKGEG